MDVRRHGVAPREAREAGGLVNVSLFIENGAWRVRSRSDFRRPDLNPGIVAFEAGMANFIGIAQGEELARSEVVLEILLGLFVAVDLDVADGEVVSVRGGCIAIAGDGQIKGNHVFADTQSAYGMNAQSLVV